MSVLMIGATEREKIAAIVAHAKAHPVPLEQVMRGKRREGALLWEDRVDTADLIRPPDEHVIFPGGFRAAFSIEEQPGGKYVHLSVSVFGRSKKGAMPHPEAVRMIAEEFGITDPQHVWSEEYEPGEFAVNVLARLSDDGIE